MNCKPGDMAVVVKDECYLIHPWTLERVQLLKPGTIVRVMRLGTRDGYWEIEEPLYISFRFPVAGNTGVAVISAISDDLLRPLRGDGVSDDEVRELYTPSPVDSPALSTQP